MEFFNIFQLAGGFLLASGYIPQIIKLIRLKRSNQFSVTWFVQLVSGIGLMEVYAIYIFREFGTWAFLVTNSVAMGLSTSVLFLIWKYRRSEG